MDIAVAAAAVAVVVGAVAPSWILAGSHSDFFMIQFGCIVAKIEYFEQQSVQLQLQMTEKVSLKKA